MAVEAGVFDQRSGATIAQQRVKYAATHLADFFPRGLVALVFLIHVALLQPTDGLHRVGLRQAGVPPGTDRRAEGGQRLLAALQEVAEQETIHLRQDEPLGPAGSAQQQAEQVRMPALPADAFSGRAADVDLQRARRHGVPPRASDRSTW